MAGRGAHLAAEAGAHPEHRLAPVVDVRRRRGHGEPAVVAEGQDPHVLAEGARPVELGRGADRAGARVDDRRVPGDALAHGGPGADDDERALLEAGQQLVEVEVAGGHAGDGLAPLVELLEAVEVVRQEVGEAAAWCR